MKIKRIYSKNFSINTHKLRKIRFLILHYTGMQSKRVSLERLLSVKHKVSCHYLIDRKGEIIQMVDNNNIAWHAGKSKWKNFKNLNFNSIGIELDNKGHRFGYQSFPKNQIKKLNNLILILKRKFKIKNNCILGHSDIAPLRKLDPGEKFPWLNIKIKGTRPGFSNIDKKFSELNDLKKNKFRNLFFKNIYKIGYRYFNKNKKSKSDRLIVKAFQRRFLQKNVNGIIDRKTLKISHYLANQVKI